MILHMTWWHWHLNACDWLFTCFYY